MLQEILVNFDSDKNFEMTRSVEDHRLPRIRRLSMSEATLTTDDA